MWNSLKPNISVSEIFNIFDKIGMLNFQSPLKRLSKNLTSWNDEEILTENSELSDES